jgi:2-(1,2-epoxy-1,2-dihydrophenyl)acetyl-CoA isomerase
MRRDLLAALETARDDTVNAVILTGEGRAFSVGQDVQELQADYASAAPQLGRLIDEEWGPLVGAIRAMPKPVIAAVNGVAAGGGLTLALAADIRLMDARASLIAAFVNVGLVPDSGAAHMLVRTLGLSKAMELCLTGEPLRADAALSSGLVAGVYPDAAALLGAASDRASRLAEAPPLATAAVKQLLLRAADAAFPAVVDFEARLQDRLGRTEDHKEAISAFLDKRRPEFRGR